MRSLTLDWTRMMLIRHGWVGKDSRGDETRAWNLLRGGFKREQFTTSWVAPIEIERMNSNQTMRSLTISPELII